jgi:hypothetical protein
MSLFVAPPITGFTNEWARQATFAINELLRTRGVFPALDVAPSDPVAGQGYHDTVTGKVLVWDGVTWQALY